MAFWHASQSDCEEVASDHDRQYYPRFDNSSKTREGCIMESNKLWLSRQEQGDRQARAIVAWNAHCRIVAERLSQLPEARTRACVGIRDDESLPRFDPRREHPE